MALCADPLRRSCLAPVLVDGMECDPCYTDVWRARRASAGVPHVENQPVERDDQPCWCPDAFREAAIPLTYCPKHGRTPDPELWDHAVEPFPQSISR